MKHLSMITIAIDGQSMEILEKVARETGMSFSSIVRNAKVIFHDIP